MKTIGIVAAEPSGDLLASLLMQAMLRQQPDLHFEGIGGAHMHKSGCQSWFAMEKLSVMGLVEVLKHLPELLAIRKSLVKRWSENPPDLFIGVDAPDFNLGLEKRLHGLDIPTVQYVSPTFWAWRQGRVNTLRKFTRLVLSIFPFEARLLNKYAVNAVYAGHPLVQGMPDFPGQSEARQVLGLSADSQVLALLPGSRMSEAVSLVDDFLQTADIVCRSRPDMQIIVPLATDRIRGHFENILKSYPQLKSRLHLYDGQSQQVMAAADLVLVASGTAALETLLHRKPMVVAYKAHWLTHFILFRLRLVKSQFIAMPNILAGREIVAEMFQEKCQPELLAKQLEHLLDNPSALGTMLQDYEDIIEQLSGGNIDTAAKAVLELLND